MERDRAHIQVWRELASAQRRSHRAEAALLKDRIAGLEQEPRARPKETLERYVDRDELDGARAKAERAFRSRENAWQGPCEVRLVHREGEPGRCRCGQRLDRCKVAMIADRYPGLEKWGERADSPATKQPGSQAPRWPSGRYQPELAALGPGARGGAHLRRPSPASAGEVALPRTVRAKSDNQLRTLARHGPRRGHSPARGPSAGPALPRCVRL